jgi:hypothetical protein
MQVKEIVKVETSPSGNHIIFSKVNIKDYVAFDGERALTNSFVMHVLGKVMGKTLTVIDASIVSDKQNKNIKDLLRSVFSEAMELTSDNAFDQAKMSKLIENDLPEDLDKIQGVSIEEVLGIEESK